MPTLHYILPTRAIRPATTHRQSCSSFPSSTVAHLACITCCSIARSRHSKWSLGPTLLLAADSLESDQSSTYSSRTTPETTLETLLPGGIRRGTAHEPTKPVIRTISIWELSNTLTLRCNQPASTTTTIEHGLQQFYIICPLGRPIAASRKVEPNPYPRISSPCDCNCLGDARSHPST